MMRVLLLTTASVLMLSTFAMADDELDAVVAETIVVTGQHEGYAVDLTATATKTPTPLIDVPQSISITTRDQIDDQAMLSIADVVRYVPGVTVGLGEGHRDQVTLRGNNSTADFFVDGVRDDVQYYRGLYNVDRVEVLKGPNAMIFGRGGGGGVINRVSKAPNTTAFAGGSASVDTFGAWYVDADINQPISERFKVRLNAVYEEFNNHRDAYGGHRVAINPTAALVIGESTSIVLSYEYAEDERLIDRGVPSRDGRPLAGFRDAFFGVKDVNRSDFQAHVARVAVEHRFGDDLKLTSRIAYGDYDKLYQNAFAATAVTTDAAGTDVLGIEAYRDPTSRQNLFSQTDVVWTTDTGPIGHVVLAGFEYGDQDTDNQRINGFFDSGVPTTNNQRRTVVDLADPVAIPPITFRAGSGNRSVRGDADIFAVYLQDQLSFGSHFDLIGGIRYDRFKLAIDNLLATPVTRLERTDDLWSPRIGAIYKPVEPVSVYVSYSRSYLPQSGDQFSSLDATIAALKPERFDNYEFGIKWNPLPELAVTAALYQLDRSNTRAPGAVSGTTVLTGEQRSKGLEVGLTGRLRDNWQVSAGYTLQDAEITETTSAAPAGRDVAQVPRHQVSVWNRYDISDRVGFGAGLYHQSKSFASISNAVTLPSYTRVDAAVYYKLNANIEAQINVENLFDESYFAAAHNDNNIAPGAPVSARFTVRSRF